MADCANEAFATQHVLMAECILPFPTSVLGLFNQPELSYSVLCSSQPMEARDAGYPRHPVLTPSSYTVSTRLDLLAKMQICHPGRYNNFVEFELFPRKGLFLFAVDGLICPTCLQRRSRLCSWDELMGPL